MSELEILKYLRISSQLPQYWGPLWRGHVLQEKVGGQQYCTPHHAYCHRTLPSHQRYCPTPPHCGIWEVILVYGKELILVSILLYYQVDNYTECMW